MADPAARLTAAERALIARAIADGIMARQEALARIEVIDNGKPLPEAMGDIADAAGCFAYYAGLAEELDGQPAEEIALADARFTAKVVREPLGVTGAIIPWNYQFRWPPRISICPRSWRVSSCGSLKTVLASSC